jgi:hypothetical protein
MRRFRGQRATDAALEKGGPLKGHDIALNAVSRFIVELALTPGFHSRQKPRGERRVGGASHEDLRCAMKRRTDGTCSVRGLR